MQIEYKEKENGIMCLFDTRSNEFFPRGCSRDVEASQDILELANEIVKNNYPALISIINSNGDGDFGLLARLIAEDYLKLNPDLKDLPVILTPKQKKERKIKEPTLTESGEVRRRGRPRKSEEEKVKKTIVLVEGQPRRRGRPRKDQTGMISLLEI